MDGDEMSDKSGSNDSAAMENPRTFMGVAREKIDWYPTINYDKCNACGDCVKFCAHDVYLVQDGKIKVKNPKNCVIFCQACIKLCPISDAMKFQNKKDVLNQIKQIKNQNPQ
jgi:NAD-dependent dihydropyrimidine dehydrogenase PreA subunit